MVEIGLTVNERQVMMHSCSRCDTRWWDSDGELLPLANLLELVGPAPRG
ncbi:MAG: hypothetical protein JWO37_2425 [Acidimicrobiales bacterium]|jgi:hypothetical protein|nr:hypothetical protein [Acidimicrobiales bacterium]